MVHSLPCIRYYVDVSVNYMASITKGQHCFFNPLFSSVSDLFGPLVRKDFTGRCYCKCHMCCSVAAPLLQTSVGLIGLIQMETYWRYCKKMHCFFQRFVCYRCIKCVFLKKEIDFFYTISDRIFLISVETLLFGRASTCQGTISECLAVFYCWLARHEGISRLEDRLQFSLIGHSC